MRIGDRELRSDEPPYVIAEIGVNHDGSVDRARRIIELLQGTGADAVKLQYFEADRLLSRAARLADYQQEAGAEDPFELLRALELPAPAMAEILECIHAIGLHAIVTMFSVEHVAAMTALPWDAFKIASPDIINRALIEQIAGTARPMILSTGAATLDEVRQALLWVTGTDHALLHCVSAYPTADSAAALGGIRALAELTGAPVGYSDHTTAVDTGALAVAAGACILEKHVTHDRTATGPDHAASLEPADLAEYVRLARRAHRMKGRDEKTVLDVEQDVRAVSRQSLTTTTALSAGQVLAREHLTIKRPGTGLPPYLLHEVIGRRLQADVEPDLPLQREHLGE